MSGDSSQQVGLNIPLRFIFKPSYSPHCINTNVRVNTLMDKAILKLKEEITSEDWQISLSAAERLANIKTKESLQVLVDSLKSENHLIRNAAALGPMQTSDQEYVEPLIKRIKELGPEEEIGTLVYALEDFDCSAILPDIVTLYLKGNFEVRQATTNILNKQSFKVTTKELNEIENELKDYEYSLDSFKVNYQLKGE